MDRSILFSRIPERVRDIYAFFVTDDLKFSAA